MPVAVSQQLMPFGTDGQLFWQSVSLVQLVSRGGNASGGRDADDSGAAPVGGGL